LLRRYVTSEPRAAEVLAACDPKRGDVHIISRLLPTEMASALALKVRVGEIGIVERDYRWGLFVIDLSAQYQLLDLDERVWNEANRLLFRRALKASDAVHIAAALLAESVSPEQRLTFWTADRQQARAAEAEGLTVELLA
jgi:uncharacterized protein